MKKAFFASPAPAQATIALCAILFCLFGLADAHLPYLKREYLYLFVPYAFLALAARESRGTLLIGIVSLAVAVIDMCTCKLFFFQDFFKKYGLWEYPVDMLFWFLLGLLVREIPLLFEMYATEENSSTEKVTEAQL